MRNKFGIVVGAFTGVVVGNIASMMGATYWVSFAVTAAVGGSAVAVWDAITDWKGVDVKPVDTHKAVNRHVDPKL